MIRLPDDLLVACKIFEHQTQKGIAPKLGQIISSLDGLIDTEKVSGHVESLLIMGVIDIERIKGQRHYPIMGETYDIVKELYNTHKF
ncbi:MAG: hypothetical protein GOU97_01785 [Nanoarchaeota archaeon]|nr:hypothetical protein [Nanoarchaeota archaeon]